MHFFKDQIKILFSACFCQDLQTKTSAHHIYISSFQDNFLVCVEMLFSHNELLLQGVIVWIALQRRVDGR